MEKILTITPAAGKVIKRARHETGVTKASEVLAGALEYWGEHGERWAVGTLDNGSRACLYGGMGRAAYGTGSYGPISLAEAKWSAADKAFKRAETLLLNEIEALGIVRDCVGVVPASIVRYNDMFSKVGTKDRRQRFANIKGVVCRALKKALEEEE